MLSDCKASTIEAKNPYAKYPFYINVNKSAILQAELNFTLYLVHEEKPECKFKIVSAKSGLLGSPTITFFQHFCNIATTTLYAPRYLVA